MINDIEIETKVYVQLMVLENINGPKLRIRYDQKSKIDFLHDCTTEIMKLRKKRGL